MLGVHGFRSVQVGSPINETAPLNRGLVSWWKVLPHRLGGPRWLDLTGRHHGTLVSSPTWRGVPHVGGEGAVQFNGSSTYVDAGVIRELAGQPQATMSALMYRASASDSAECGTYRAPYRFTLLWGNDGAEVFYTQVEDGADAYTRLLYSGTGWHHVVMVYDGTQAVSSDRVQVYANGVLRTLDFSSGTYPTVLTTLANQPAMRMGMYNYSGADEFWGGMLDDIHLWTRALSAEQVTRLYLAMLQGYPQELAWQVWPPLAYRKLAAPPPWHKPWRVWRRAA